MYCILFTVSAFSSVLPYVEPSVPSGPVWHEEALCTAPPPSRRTRRPLASDSHSAPDRVPHPSSLPQRFSSSPLGASVSSFLKSVSQVCLP